MRGIKKSFVAIATSISLFCTAITMANPISASAVNIQLPNYPQFSQNGSNCWAYVIKSMLDYKTGTSNNVSIIYSAYGTVNGSPYVLNSGATLGEAYNVINYLFSGYSPTMYTSPLTSNQIQSQIANGNPVYIKGNNIADFTDGHAVALIGFGLSVSLNVNKIIYMNTQVGMGLNHIDSHSYNSGSLYSNKFYNYNHSVEYQWSGSITLN